MRSESDSRLSRRIVISSTRASVKICGWRAGPPRPEEIEAAARAAQIHEFILELAEGL